MNDKELRILITVATAQMEAALARATASVKATTDSINASGAGAAAAAQQMDTAVTAAAARATESTAAIGAAAEASAAATARLSSVDEERAARIHQVVEASLTRKAAQEAALVTERAGTAATRDAAAALGASAAAARNYAPDVMGLGAAYELYEEALAGTAKGADALAAQEAALDKLMAAGLISEEEQAAALAAITAEEEKLGLAKVATTAATKAETEAALGLKLASGQAVREYTALLDEVLSGRTGRTPGTLAVLGSRIGLTQKLFSATGLAVMGAVAAVGAFVAVVLKAEEEEAAFNAAIAATGGYLGVTRGQLHGFAADIATGTHTMGDAKTAILAVANSGRFAGDQIRMIGQAALNMAEVTGRSVDDAVQEFIKLGDSPLQAAIDLDRQYHFLTAAVYDQIAALEAAGNVRAAGEVAQQAAAAAMAKRAKNIDQHLGTLQKAWKAVAEGASDAWDKMLHLGADETPEDKLDDLKKHLTKLQTDSFSVDKFGNVTKIPAAGDNDPAVIALKAQIAAQQKLLDAADKAAAAQSKQRQADADYIAAAQSIDKMKSELLDANNAQSELNKLNEEFSAIAKAHPEELKKRGVTQDAAGNFHGGEYDKLYAAIEAKAAAHDKRMAELKAQAAAAAERAREQAFEAQLADLKRQEAAAQAGGEERIRLAKQIAKQVGETYGLQSKQYRAALADEERAERQHAAALARIHATELEAARDHALAGLDLDRQRIRLAGQLGQLSAAEQIQQLEALENQRYRIEQAALLRERLLHAGDAEYQAKTQAKLQKLADQHSQAMLKLQSREALAVKEQWLNVFEGVTSAVQQSINGMIQGTQTLRAAVLGIGDAILAEFVNMGVKMLAEWVANMLGMGAATQSGALISIPAYAATAAAASAASVAAIPVTGWAMAPEVAATTYATTLGYMGLAVAERGFDIPANVNPLTQLHKREMVLPAPLADKVRTMTDGGTHHWHIHAVDAKSFKRLMLDNPDAFAAAAHKAMRNRSFS